MLRSVSEVADLTGLSKVSIYNKLKLKELKPFIVKNRGVTYITDEGVKLINKGVNCLNDRLNLNDTEIALDIENTSFDDFKEEFKILNKDYINTLKSEIATLKEQLCKKDKQIEELISLNKNNQILLKQQQDKEINIKLLDDHFNEVDQKLIDIRNRMEEKKNAKRFFKIFSK